jgi:hypothetical protein
MIRAIRCRSCEAAGSGAQSRKDHVKIPGPSRNATRRMRQSGLLHRERLDITGPIREGRVFPALEKSLRPGQRGMAGTLPPPPVAGL